MLEVESAARLPEGAGRGRWLVSFAGVADRRGAEPCAARSCVPYRCRTQAPCGSTS